MSNIGFIGCGNMGGALLRAILKQVDESLVFVSDYDVSKCEEFCRETGANCMDNEYICQNCEYIFLAVKPQVMESVLAPLKSILKKRKDRFVLITMAAGLSKEAVQNFAGGSFPIIRIMPNTPCSIGEGIILYTASSSVTTDEIATFKKMLQCAGMVDEIPEATIDAAAALSGCGPAFAYLFIEALADGAVSCGVARDKALIYAAQTVSGAAQMVVSTGKHPGELKDAVCSPGGTTIAGVKALEDSAFRSAAMSSVIAAFKKTQDLKK